MTRNKNAKAAARERAARTGRSYADARRQITSEAAADGRSVISADDLHRRLGDAFHDAGWPVEAEDFYTFGEYNLFAGPVSLTVGRGDPSHSWSGEEDPDDGGMFDLKLPPMIGVSAPLLPADHQIGVRLDGSIAVTDIVQQVGDLLAGGRAEAMRKQAAQAQCVNCTATYERRHLLTPTTLKGDKTCPACVFDGDLFAPGAMSALMFDVDALHEGDLATPAGWGAVSALLACCAPLDLADDREDDTPLTSWQWWAGPGDIWIWLPTGPRPVGLERFGPGARLSAIVEAIDAAHPGLRDRVRADIVEADAQAGADCGAGNAEGPGALVEALWPAILAYVVAFTTQADERSGERPSLVHVVENFGALQDRLTQIGSDMDLLAVTHTMGSGLHVVGPALGL